MKKLITNIGPLELVELEQVKEQAIALWKTSFKEDTLLFAKNYFDKYQEFVESHFYVNENKQLVLMAFNTIESFNDHPATLIEGIAVAPEFQGKGIMSVFMDKWVKDLDKRYEYVFIQAYIWEIYKKYNFVPCTKNNLYEFTATAFNPDLKIENKYLNAFPTDIKRSKKHHDTYLDLLLLDNGKAISYKSASAVIVGDYALHVTFESEQDLFDLFSSLKTRITFLYSSNYQFHNYLFKLVEENKVETKLLNKKNVILYNYIF